MNTSNPTLLDLIVRRIALRAKLRTAWLDHLDGVQPGEEVKVRGFDGRDTVEAQAAWCASDGSGLAGVFGELESIEARLQGEEGEVLSNFASLFVLSPAEVDLLQAALALVVEPTLGPVYARLNGHRAREYLTEALARRLFDPYAGSLWNPSGSLARWSLLRADVCAAGEPEPLVLDPMVRHWLMGALELDAELLGVARIVPVQSALSDWPLEDLTGVSRRILGRGDAIRITVVGPPLSGRRSLAATVAGDLGLPTLAVDTGAIADTDWEEMYLRAQRFALVARAALVWHGSQIARPWPTRVPSSPVQFLALSEEQEVPGGVSFVERRVVMPSIRAEEREELWRTQVDASRGWPEPDFKALVARHRLTVGDIVSIGRRAPESMEEASLLAREQTRNHLHEMGKLLDCPFVIDDLIIVDKLRESLKDFIFEAKERANFWESNAADRLFPRGKGLVGLMAGTPGTGKTMAAQVVARELELDLFRIDLATVVSKYIGETAKNLHKIFSRAARMNAVLFFDEADALFSKRTEVKDSHDRHANADTNYLLQLLEDYQGVALMATNKKNNIDPAFIRRVRYIFDFKDPQPEERRRIWRRVLSEVVGEDHLRSLEPVIAALSDSVAMTGAEIKNSVIAAVFIAKRQGVDVHMKHLLAGSLRELGKSGRTLNHSEHQRLKNFG